MSNFSLLWRQVRSNLSSHAWTIVCCGRWRTSKLILGRIWIWIINCDKWKIHCHFFNISDRELAHGRAVFNLCCQLSFFDWLKGSSIYSRKLTRFFFKTSRYSVLAWIFSGFYFAKAGVSSIYYFHIPYSFWHLYPSRVYVTNLAASGVTGPLAGLKPIVGVVQDSNSRHD